MFMVVRFNRANWLYRELKLAAAYVGDRSEIDGWNSYHNPEQFQNINLLPKEVSRASGYFSVVAPIIADSQTNAVRFGLMNESGKLNLNITGK